MFCSLVVRVVNLACLIDIARCLEALQRVTELVLLHNSCQMVPLNVYIFEGIYLEFAKYCGTQQGVVNLPSLPHFTVHFPQRPPLGSPSHSTPDVGSPPRQSFKTTTLSFTNRCHIRPTNCSDL